MLVVVHQLRLPKGLRNLMSSILSTVEQQILGDFFSVQLFWNLQSSLCFCSNSATDCFLCFNPQGVQLPPSVIIYHLWIPLLWCYPQILWSGFLWSSERLLMLPSQTLAVRCCFEQAKWPEALYFEALCVCVENGKCSHSKYSRSKQKPRQLSFWSPIGKKSIVIYVTCRFPVLACSALRLQGLCRFIFGWQIVIDTYI